MLRFFKNLLPTRLLALLLLVQALRLPLLLWLGHSLSAAELRLLLLGERLHGGALPYRDLYDGTAPLAAATATLLQAVLPRPVLLYWLLALGLLLAQALRLHTVLNRVGAHPERGYVAALTYLLVGSLSTDLDTLSPLLLGHTFVVFALSALLPTSRAGYDNRRLFRAGFLIGVAALCYLPLALFVGVGLFAVALFAASSFRSALLLLCGFLFPYAVVATFFLYVGALPGFGQFHLEPALRGRSAGLDGLPAAVQLPLLAVPVALLALALLRTGATALGLVFQAKFRQLMLVWLLVAVGVGAAGLGVTPGTLVLVLPPLAYFSQFLWQRARPAWAPEVLLLLTIGVVATLRYRAAVPGLETALHLPAESRFALHPDPALARLQGQRVLVLGPDRRAYLTNQLATPYLDWSLAQADFGHLNEYAALVRVAQQTAANPPVYIIDQQRLMPRLRGLMPGVFGRYKLTETPGVWQAR
ncbi:hypothetical protein [uncultured Hymenobacter sp.]|uniref:hypothetical protein n=1 Tax=uncultured Hymenobacter sp. TaxID=170016 RepID=UPI0035CB1F3C